MYNYPANETRFQPVMHHASQLGRVFKNGLPVAARHNSGGSRKPPSPIAPKPMISYRGNAAPAYPHPPLHCNKCHAWPPILGQERTRVRVISISRKLAALTSLGDTSASRTNQPGT